MARHSAHPEQLVRYLILSGLLILSILAWALLIWQSSVMRNQAMTPAMGMSLTMGMGAFLFIAIWILMMIAMMFPTAAPMILMFTKIYARKRQQGSPFVPTWVFVSAYLLVWSVFGAVAYPLAAGIDKLAEQSTWPTENVARFGGAILLVTGLYQLSPLKDICLSKCRTPWQFILGSWRDGYMGAFRMGVAHGTYCLGCCWLLFVILFPLGIMNLAVMALVTALIFVEKALPIGQQISRLAGMGLIIYGGLVMLLPAILPMGM